jgi:hypothetical protein
LAEVGAKEIGKRWLLHLNQNVEQLRYIFEPGMSTRVTNPFF